MCVRVKIEREKLVFVSAYRLGSGKSEEETGFRNELNGFGGSFGSALGFKCQSGK